MLLKEDQVMMDTMYWWGIPTKDQPNNITSMVAASIMFEIISLISFNLKN